MTRSLLYNYILERIQMSQMSLMEIKLNVKRKHLENTNCYKLLDMSYRIINALISFMLNEVF